MSTTNFSGFGGGVSAISTGPLIVSMTVPQTITSGSNNPVIWNNIQNAVPWMSYNTSTGFFTANVSGIYTFQFLYGIVYTSSVGNTFDVLLLNGVQQGAENIWAQGAFNPDGNLFLFIRFHEFLLNVGDQLNLQINGNTGNIIQGDPTLSRANVMLLQGVPS